MSRASAFMLGAAVVAFAASCGAAHRETDAGFANDPAVRARLAELRASPPPKAVGGGPRALSDETASAIADLTSARCAYLARCAGPVNDAECMRTERAWAEQHVACDDIDREAAQTCVESLKTASCDRLLEVTVGLPECMALSLCRAP